MSWPACLNGQEGKKCMWCECLHDDACRKHKSQSDYNACISNSRTVLATDPNPSTHSYTFVHDRHISNDKDMLQLVGEGVHVLNPTNHNLSLIGSNEVQEKYRIQPHQMVDYLTLIGDRADNIPGVDGIGPKNASALLKYFGSVDQMIAKLSLPAIGIEIPCAATPIHSAMSAEPAAIAEGIRNVPSSSRRSKSKTQVPSPVLLSEESLKQLTDCLQASGTKGSPRKLLHALLRTGADQLRLFGSLVRLRSDLPPEAMAMSSRDGNEQLTCKDFAYGDKGCLDQADELNEVSPLLDKAVRLIRQHYRTARV